MLQFQCYIYLFESITRSLHLDMPQCATVSPDLKFVPYQSGYMSTVLIFIYTNAVNGDHTCLNQNFCPAHFLPDDYPFQATMHAH